jgi:hypothetical protein
MLLVISKYVREVFVVIFYKPDLLAEFLKVLVIILSSVLVETQAFASQ